MPTRRSFLETGALLGTALAAVPKEAGAKPMENERNAWRVFDTQTGKSISWRELSDRLASARVVFMGEQHDDPQSHKVELALFETLHQKAGKKLTFALEMFERDQQAALDDYLAGKTTEAEFGNRAKWWPNYPTDYRPLIEFAKAKQIPVTASNAPGRIVKRVGKEGATAVLSSLPNDDKALIAAQNSVPDLNGGDEYAKRFAGVMGAGGGHGETTMPADMVQRFFEAQCLRDDTMAESVARLTDAGRTVLHLSGGFHIASGLGTMQRFLWRRPLLAPYTRVVQIIPVKSAPDPVRDKSEAHFLIYVPDTRPPAK